MESAAFVRAHDRDRYLSALLAREPARSQLMALYAADIELRSIPRRVSEPLVGEMRLQWWRDTIAALCEGRPSGNPRADALMPAIQSGRLPLAAFEQMIEAHRIDAYGEMMRTQDELAAYCGAAFGIPVQLACLVLSGGQETPSGTAAGHAGVVAGIIWILEQIGAHAAQGRVYLPGDLLARHAVNPQALLQGRAEEGLSALCAELTSHAGERLDELNDSLFGLDMRLRPAFAHLAPARGRLAAATARRDWLQPPRLPSPLRAQWAIWRFARSGRI